MPTPIYLYSVFVSFQRNQIKYHVNDEILSKTKFDTKTQLEVDLVNQYELLDRHYRHIPVGFEDVIAKYHGLLTKHQKEDHQMVLITGGEGSGKSCLMSHLAKTCPELLGKEETVVILRYLADLSPSFNVSDLLLSICKQISFILKVPMEFTPAKSLTELKDSFAGLLKTTARARQGFLVVLDGLDSVKPLPNQEHGHSTKKLEWLTAKLPENFHLVASFLTSVRTEEDLVRIKEKLFYNENILPLPKLEEKHILTIVNDVLNEYKRQLAPDQLETVLNSVKSTGSPLLLEFVLSDAVTWKPCCDCDIPDTIFGMVHKVGPF